MTEKHEHETWKKAKLADIFNEREIEELAELFNNSPNTTSFHEAAKKLLDTPELRTRLQQKQVDLGFILYAIESQFLEMARPAIPSQDSIVELINKLQHLEDVWFSSESIGNKAHAVTEVLTAFKRTK